MFVSAKSLRSGKPEGLSIPSPSRTTNTWGDLGLEFQSDRIVLSMSILTFASHSQSLLLGKGRGGTELFFSQARSQPMSFLAGGNQQSTTARRLRPPWAIKIEERSDKVCDELEDMMEEGGNIVDYHGCDFFPERWFDRVVVLQTENSVLYDRLSKRGYTGSKLTNNMECEIFQVLLEEAKNSYPEDIVVPLRSDTVDDINRNIVTLTDWAGSWCPKP